MRGRDADTNWPMEPNAKGIVSSRVAASATRPPSSVMPWPAATMYTATDDAAAISPTATSRVASRSRMTLVCDTGAERMVASLPSASSADQLATWMIA